MGLCPACTFRGRGINIPAIPFYTSRCPLLHLLTGSLPPVCSRPSHLHPGTRRIIDLSFIFIIMCPFIDYLSVIAFQQCRKTAWTPDAARHPNALYSVQVRVSSGTGQVCAAECFMLSHTACLRPPQFTLHPDFPSTPGCGPRQQAVSRLPPPFIDYRRPIIEPRSIFGDVDIWGDEIS